MGSGPAVLLVDDDDRVLAALRRALRREPFEIETASNGAKALARIAIAPDIAPPIALVISDYKMPGMNGVELLTAVRAEAPETARILLSGWTSEIPPAALAAAGLFAVHAKPWDDRQLKHSIRDALGVG